MPAGPKSCYAVSLGRMEYRQALDLQMQICAMKKQGFDQDILLILEHPPTITIGRNGKWRHLLVSEDELSRRGIQRHEVDRGGDITFHGPGQLVGYPILKLGAEEQDVRRYMWNLEEVLLRVLMQYGIRGLRHESLTGVWTAQGKIAAMGVHITRWITRHGFALNVNTELSFFDLIVPCGIEGKGVASMNSVLQRQVNLGDVSENLAHEFGFVFGREMIWSSGEDLLGKLNRYAREVAVA